VLSFGKRRLSPPPPAPISLAASAAAPLCKSHNLRLFFRVRYKNLKMSMMLGVDMISDYD
jgi:hypothetical protein